MAITGKSTDAADSSRDREIAAIKDGTIYRAAVDAKLNLSGNLPHEAISKKLRYVDMNASSGGVARGTDISTTWTDIFSYSGSGLFFGFTSTLESFGLNWYVRLVVDSEEIFGSSGIHGGDIVSGVIYNMPDLKNMPDHGFIRAGNAFRFQPSNPIAYASSVSIKVKKDSGDKKFQAGLAVLTKES